jgi:hypothetical protein
MPIVNNADLETLELPGLRHQTIAGHRKGVESMEVVHQIVNTSADEMRLVGNLSMSQVRVRTAEGEPLPLPWEAPAK